MKKRWKHYSNRCVACGGDGIKKIKEGTRVPCADCGGTGWGPKEPPDEKADFVATSR